MQRSGPCIPQHRQHGTTAPSSNRVTVTLNASVDTIGYLTVLQGSGAVCGTAQQTEAGQDSTGAAAYRRGSLALVAGVHASYTVRNLEHSANYTLCAIDNADSAVARTHFSTAAMATYSSPSWQAVGSAGFSAGEASYQSLTFAPDGTPYVAYRDYDTNTNTTVMRFVNGNWENVGSAGFSAEMTRFPSLSIAPDGTPYVAYQDVTPGYEHILTSGVTTVMRFVSGNWESVGSAGLSAVAASYQSLSFAPDGTPYVAYRDGDNSGKTTVMRLVGLPGAPTIGTATAGDGQASVSFTAPANNGGSAITTYTATSNPDGRTGTCTGPSACTITVGSLTNGRAYTFTVTATNGVGTGLASGASNSVTPMADQIITFVQPPSYNFGTAPTLSASSSYALGGGATGLAISFTSSTTGVCTINDSTGLLAFHSAGTCTIDADQPGNSSTNAASTVTRSFTVNAVVPGAPTIGTAKAGNLQAAVYFTPPAFNGGAAITGYTVTANQGGATATGAGSPIVVAGLANGTAYTFTVTAANSVGAGSPSGASNSVIPQATAQGTVPLGASGTGIATAAVAAVNPVMDPTCSLAAAQFTNEIPPDFNYTYGSFEFLASGCNQGITITLTYPQPLATDVTFMKYGPKTGVAVVGGVDVAAPSEWFEWTGVTVSANRRTISYTVLDNGPGDADPRVGYIDDPIAPVALAAPVPMAPAGTAAIPTLNAWALALLAALLGALGWWRAARPA